MGVGVSNTGSGTVVVKGDVVGTVVTVVETNNTKSGKTK